MDVREKLVELLKEIVAIQECGFGDPRPTYETVARYLMSHGVTVQEWISAAKRLPDIGVEVLVYSENFGIHVDYYDGDAFGYFHVTQWMPLPEPPKGE